MHVLLDGNDESLAELYEELCSKNLGNAVPVHVRHVLQPSLATETVEMEDDSVEISNEEEMKETEMVVEGDVLLTSEIQKEDGSFTDPATGLSFSINHFNMEIDQVTMNEADVVRSSPLASSVSLLVEKYVKDSLRSNGRFQVVERTINNQSSSLDGTETACDLAIVMVGERFQAVNMRNGQWKSCWQCCLAGNSWQIQGDVDIFVHYFEEGNVQLVAHRTANLSANFSEQSEEGQQVDVKDQARALVDVIRKCEDDIQVSLNSAYTRLGDSVFKKLRRQLPVTRSKVDWYVISFFNVFLITNRNKLASYRVGSALNNSDAAAAVASE